MFTIAVFRRVSNNAKVFLYILGIKVCLNKVCPNLLRNICVVRKLLNCIYLNN